MDQSGLLSIGVLAVVTYSIYMLCHIWQGTLAPNGLLLSGVIGFLGLLAGIKWNGFQQQKAGKESTDAGIVTSGISSADPPYIR